MNVIETFLDATAVWSPTNGIKIFSNPIIAVGWRPDGGIDLPSSSACIK